MINVEVVHNLNFARGYCRRLISRLIRSIDYSRLYECWVSFFNLLVDRKSKLVKNGGNQNFLDDFKKNIKNYLICGSVMKKKM